MNYASVCSGVEAASLAWMPIGWKPVWFSEIEPFGQRHVTVVIGVPVRIVVGPLPAEELPVEGILLFPAPLGKLLFGQRRTKVVAEEHLEQFDLPQPPPEIVAAQSPGICPVLDGRFFIVFVAGNALLEDVDTFVDQRISAFGFFDDGPPYRVGAEIQSQYFCHKRKCFL